MQCFQPDKCVARVPQVSRKYEIFLEFRISSFLKINLSFIFLTLAEGTTEGKRRNLLKCQLLQNLGFFK